MFTLFLWIVTADLVVLVQRGFSCTGPNDFGYSPQVAQPINNTYKKMVN
jgi:hypothetical protein